MITLWHIWEVRNDVRNGESEMHPFGIVEKLTAYVDMVLLHLYNPVVPNRCDSHKSKRWDPPHGGWVMVNVDAAIFHKTNRMGLGIVIRDHKGDFLAACRQGIDRITNPELAEAIAFRQAILFASELSYNRAIVATDCLSLIRKLQSEAMDRSHTGIIIQDIKKAVYVSSVVFSFIHVSRSCNEVAHVLARSTDQISELVWFHVAPEFLWSSLCNDRLSE